MPAHTNTMNKPKLLPFKHTNKTKNIDIYIVYYANTKPTGC